MYKKHSFMKNRWLDPAYRKVKPPSGARKGNPCAPKNSLSFFFFKKTFT
jgi:hypothetical protein